MIVLLAGVFFILLLLIGQDKGIDILWTLIWNFVTFISMVFLINLTGNVIVVTILACIIVSMLTLFFQNGYNIKTRVAFLSVVIVVLINIVIIYCVTTLANIQGFGSEYLDINESYGYLSTINISMTSIAISMALTGLIGAIIDTALSISSAGYEIYVTGSFNEIKPLFVSCMNVGKDILGTTINTLFFIFSGDCFTLMLFYSKTSSFAQVINSKIFNQEVLFILYSTLGCIMIIPVTAIISSYAYISIAQSED
ncbi:MAG: YibE/F family protein [Lachnospiraceae bacterium]|nr:YibE/F family protein [Lachnospiraceae bacterium]